MRIWIICCIMEEKRLKNLYNLLKEFAPYAGHIAMRNYGKIKHIEYKDELRKDGTINRTPVTNVDIEIQQKLLERLIGNGFYDFAFNGEEDTVLKGLMKGDLLKDWTIHCDPLDGTDPYIKGNGYFAFGCGVSSPEKEFVLSVVYSPLEQQLYFASPWDKSHVKKDESSRTVFCSRKILNPAGRKELENRDFKFVDISSTHIHIVKTALGDLGAFMLANTQVHDALVPYAFANAHGVKAYDDNGKVFDETSLKIVDCKYERIPRICFFASEEIKKEVLDVLNKKEHRTVVIN